MAVKIELKLESGSILLLKGQQVFNATLIVSDSQGIVQELNAYLSSPLPPEILRFLARYDPVDDSLKFRSLLQVHDTRLTVVKFKSIDSQEAIDQINDLKACLNHWLNNAWIDETGIPTQKIKNTLEIYYHKASQSKEEIQIIVRAENSDLRRLPWQEWDILHDYWQHHQAEIAISATDYKRPYSIKTAQIRASVRILAVFGNENVGVAQDRNLIQKLNRFGGEIKLLNQPTREELEKALSEREGWHIFFFAGHSRSDGNFHIGWLEIKPGLEISIQDLKNLMEKSIQNKLQLAIFNSCDGLGLANQLTNLSLPYCIVMREPIEYRAAQTFLKSFLDAFIQGKSLFASVYQARQYLLQEYDLKRGQIGTSWLPVIVVNPLAKPLTWNSLFTERRIDTRWEFLLAIAAIVASIGLPLSIWQEFGRESLMFYAQLYPHLIVYPSLFLWVALYSFYRVLCMTRERLKLFISLISIIFIFTLGTTYQELHSNYMMLFEFKRDASTTVSPELLNSLLQKQQLFKEELLQIPHQIFEIDKALDKKGSLLLNKESIEKSIERFLKFPTQLKKEQENAYQSLLEIHSTYDVWQDKNDRFSRSRYFYGFSFFTIAFVGAEIITFVIYTLIQPNSVFNKNKHLIYLLACEAGILLWVPFHFYYNQSSKHLLFETAKFNLLNLNIGIYLVFIVLTLLTFPLIERQASKSYKGIFRLALILFLLFIIVLSLNAEEIINQVFGLESVPSSWGIMFMFLVIVLPVIRYIVDASVQDD